MNLLIKKILNINFFILLRNSFNFRPVSIKIFKKKYPITVSDAFLWKTDNGYKTKFKYSNILDLFYKIKDSFVEFHFYSKDNKLIKIERVNSLNLSNEFEITSEYLDNIKDYGVFYIYHFSNNKSDLNYKNIISNRCYIGYSQNNNLYSFVHGNTLSRFTSINSHSLIFTNLVKTSFFKNHIYTIQKYFDDFDKNELYFVNPTSNIIHFSLDKKNYKLSSGCSLLIEPINSIVSIKSNCLFLRPTVFSYKGKYLDVHHS